VQDIDSHALQETAQAQPISGLPLPGAGEFKPLQPVGMRLFHKRAALWGADPDSGQTEFNQGLGQVQDLTLSATPFIAKIKE
jgi:hypothetical protein